MRFELRPVENRTGAGPLELKGQAPVGGQS